jgi:hypothetical protein
MKAWGSGGRAPLFLTTALDGGEWSASGPAALPPVPIGQEAGCTPKPVWMLWRREKNLAQPGIEPRSFSLLLYWLNYPNSYRSSMYFWKAVICVQDHMVLEHTVTLKMEVTTFFKLLVPIYLQTKCHNIVTYEGLAWLIIMGSGFDDWIYWHFFTITVNYDSSQSMTVYDSLPSLLDHECLLFHCDEWWTMNHCSHIELFKLRLSDESLLWMNKTLITSRQPEYRSPSPTVRLLLCVVCCSGNIATCC